MKNLVRLIVFLGVPAWLAGPAHQSYQHYRNLQASNAAYIAWRSHVTGSARTFAAGPVAEPTRPRIATPAGRATPGPGR